MFFVETREAKLTDEDNGESWGIIHFVLGESAILCPCYYNAEEGTTSPEAWSEPFVHYGEAEWEAKSSGEFREVVRCSKCFDSMMIKTGGPVFVNVVVFAEGCVDPEILVTLDEDVARKFYLEKEVELDEDDLITWQSVNITMPSEKQVL